jgi:hypothetical protein
LPQKTKAALSSGFSSIYCQQVIKQITSAHME